MFETILFPPGEALPGREQDPECFRDLNLDQIFAPILKKEEKYHIGPWFYTPLHSKNAVCYRQEILKDLEKPELRQAFEDFSAEIYGLGLYMEECRKYAESRDPWHDNDLNRGHILWFAERYCRAVEELLRQTDRCPPKSRGLTEFLQFLRDYAASPACQEMARKTRDLRQRFSALRYCMLIHNGTVRVKKYEGEADLSVRVEELFRKFRQGEVREYRQKFPEEPHAAHVEAGVLSCLAKIYPEEFRDLREFCEKFLDFMDPTIFRFSGEIRFYLSWLRRTGDLARCGLGLCYPTFPDNGHLEARSFYDLALAGKIGSKIVVNDFSLDAPERILVVTGPNQGGKTTFARALGQMHYLASLGLSVPGRHAELCLPDQVLTHFERQEDLSTLNGKLEDELERLRDLLTQAGKNSVIIINEIFASTTLKDAEQLGRHMMDRLASLGAFCVVVTFLDELARHGKETVSMMSLVRDGKRTFEVRRKPPDGLAYARQAAERYGLTYEKLKGRIRP